MTGFGWMMIAAGIFSLAAAHYRWMERMQERPRLRWLFLPYRVLDVRWIGGGHRRYLRTTGWFFLILGSVLVLSGHWTS
jgi:hypothetical protein